jgi:hypothetical protein
MNNFYLRYYRGGSGYLVIEPRQNTETFKEYPGLLEDLSRMAETMHWPDVYFITKEQANVLQNLCDTLGVILRDRSLISWVDYG